MKASGLFLMAMGILMTVFIEFNILPRKEVVDFGAVAINRERETPMYWSPITGGVLLVSGVLLLALGKKRSVMSGRHMS